MDNRKIQINKELDSQQKLAKHVADLHLGSIRQYKQWCIKHGFDTSLKKRNKVLASERAYAAELARKAIAERTRRSRRVRAARRRRGNRRIGRLGASSE